MKILKHIIILFFFTSSALANGFTDSHDSTKSYAHPSFVLYNDEPYRTLKAVPVNTLITNTEYWVSLKTEASQQTLPQGETPPETDTSQLTNSVPTNDTPLVAPSFSVGSTDAVNYQENGSSSVYTADATGALSYSISSGDDIGLFEINSATGVLTFKSSPDYESPTDQGSNNNYSVTITATNSAGTAELSLSVVVTDDTSDNVSATSRIVNISTRGFVGTGDDVLIGGFVIKGTEPKKVLIRALGPSLASKDVSGALNNPYLYVVNQVTGVQVAVNTSWESPIDSEDISPIIGDPIFAPGDPKDAAMILTLEPGDYSAVVADEGGQTGIALIEVNEFDSVEETRLKNISTRGFVGTGDDVLIGGFVVKGTEPIRVLVRALGPSLASKGVSGALNNPYLYVVNQVTGVQVAVNTSWESPIDSDDISEIEGDALFEPGNPKDAAMILTLEPGDYSAVVADEAGQTGIALIEVNEF